uniref:DRBM domain-containing protein n=1 Tax=Glossina brevipalpis TaxID=37001 RepID=A0A1A9W0G7_9MUSC
MLQDVNVSQFTMGNGEGFVVLVKVNGKQYEGNGISKPTAKSSACEKALRDYYLRKKYAKECIAPTDGEREEVDSDKELILNFASFALHKLYYEWEKESLIVPRLHTLQHCGNPNGAHAFLTQSKLGPARNKLPNDWECMHPTSLLCLMQPDMTFVYKGIVDDDQEFIGYGHSKKEARRKVAGTACDTLYGTKFGERDHEAFAQALLRIGSHSHHFDSVLSAIFRSRSLLSNICSASRRLRQKQLNTNMSVLMFEIENTASHE